MEKQELTDFFKKDRFARSNGIQIESIEDEWTVCKVRICDNHKNAVDGVQGGLIFTLADFAFAVAANKKHFNTVSLQNSITFNRQPKGEMLIAAAKEISSTHTTCLYEVRISDELGTQVAFMTVNGFKKNNE
ncbi:MAG: PaaI family thioesterase [Christensenellaceae bacterium]